MQLGEEEAEAGLFMLVSIAIVRDGRVSPKPRARAPPVAHDAAHEVQEHDR